MKFKTMRTWLLATVMLMLTVPAMSQLRIEISRGVSEAVPIAVVEGVHFLLDHVRGIANGA